MAPFADQAPVLRIVQMEMQATAVPLAHAVDVIAHLFLPAAASAHHGVELRIGESRHPVDDLSLLKRSKGDAPALAVIYEKVHRVWLVSRVR